MPVKFSLLIPAYNAEKYIARCLKSVLAQTYRDYEVIIIDDGSTDATLSICEEFCAKSDKIRLYSQGNHKIAYTRNRLLEESIGDWIAFVDADDYINPHYLEAFNDAISSDTVPDAFCCDKYEVYYYRRKSVNCEFSSKEEYINQAFDCKPLKRCVFGKVIRRKLIEKTGMRFEEGINMGEDLLFISRLFYFASEVKHVPAYFYYHDKRGTTSMTRSNKSACTQEKLAYYGLIDAFFKMQVDYQKYCRHIENMHFRIYVDDFIFRYIYGGSRIASPEFDSHTLFFKNRIYKWLMEKGYSFALRVAVSCFN